MAICMFTKESKNIKALFIYFKSDLGSTVKYGSCINYMKLVDSGLLGCNTGVLVRGYHHFGGTYCLHTSALMCKSGTHLQVHMALQPRRPQSTFSLP
jgi:hypothetical protein